VKRKKAEKKEKISPVPSESFTGKNLTRFGGAGLIRRFCEKIGLRKRLASIEVEGRRESTYSPGAMCEMILYGLLLGIFRPSHMMELVFDKVFQQIAGLPGFPVQSTISRFLGRVTESVAGQVSAVNDRLLREKLKAGRGLKTATMDLDSHVITVYGNQEGAAKGYNPKKRGRKSFHPLLCFLGETRDVLGGLMRSGNASDSADAQGFVEKMIARLPRGIRLRLRADSGFFDSKFIRWLKAESIVFAIVVPQWVHIQRAILRIKEWREVSAGITVASMQIPLEGKETVRAVVVRQAVAEGEEPKKQLKLFSQESIRYDYQVIATNSHAAGEHVWRFYNQRACCENMIKEGIEGFGLDKSVCHSFDGTQLYFELVLLAYNLMNRFKETALAQTSHKETAGTVRWKLLWIPGKLVRSARKLELKLADWWAFKKSFHDAATALG